MSTRSKAGSAPASKTDRFTLVYASSKKPSTRHLDKRCWSSTTYREATAEEMQSIPACKHCVKRAEQDARKAQEAEKPKREPIPQHEPAPQPKSAEKASVTA